MSDTKHLDFIIVGFGIAGALLSYRLREKLGKTVLAIDPCPEVISSRAAAGILNPVTGKRLVKSWRVEDMLPAARKIYREIEKNLGATFYYNKTIRRIYQSEEELKRWNKRIDQPIYQSFLGKQFEANTMPEEIQDPLGSFEIRGVGNLNTDHFLDVMIDWATEQEILLKETFVHEGLSITENGVKWKDWSANHVVFCEGYQVSGNPWFKWLPMSPAKGEILTLSGIDLGTTDILSKQKWVLPIEDGKFISGSTWSWDHLNEEPTHQGKSGLLQGLSKMIRSPDSLTIHAHRAGVRPCTDDRHPYNGKHPEYPQLSVFNGFGSKGALMTPLLCNEFTDHLLNDVPLDPEADIKRVIDHYPGASQDQ